jgi:cytochrome c biogenesis protein CcmG/thiol:disulfide interchange protein DsbE
MQTVRKILVWCAVTAAFAILALFALPSYRQGETAIAGKKADDFPMTLAGQAEHLSDLKGKVVVLNFWATWCEPCQVEIPWMIDLQQKNADKGFTILGAAMDDEGASVVQPYVQKTEFDVDGHQMKMNYPIVLGTDDITSKFGGLIGLPTTVVITRDGKIAKRFIGLANRDQLEKQIRAAL